MIPALRLAVASLAAAALAFPAPAPAEPTRDAERKLQQLQESLAFAEQEYTRRDESASARARRKFSQAQVHFLQGEWSDAVLLLYEVVDEPSFRDSPDLAEALYEIGESQFQLGNLPTAKGYFRQVLDRAGAPRRREALLRSLDLSIRLRDFRDVDRLVAAGRELYPEGPPPELRFLVAKATVLRRDLPREERAQRALEALAAVPAPYEQSAAFLRGSLLVEAGDLEGAAAAFEACGRTLPADDRQREVRDLCQLGAGRVRYEQRRFMDAVDRYQEIPRESPHFNEALYEIAWSLAQAGRTEQALRTAALISDLSPESPLAPRAALLQGQLQLKLGRHAEAAEIYGRVLSEYGPVRDQVDGVLLRQPDPVRYLDELAARSDKAFDVGAVLPPGAVRWARNQSEVARATRINGDLVTGRRDLQESQDIAQRVAAILARDEAVAAFPHLREGYARADAVENGAVRLEGQVLDVEEAMTRSAAGPAGTVALERARAARLAVEAKARSLPTTPEEVEERLARQRARLAEVDQAAFRAGYLVESNRAALAAAQLWLDQNPAGEAGAEGRTELEREIARSREQLAEQEEALRALRQEVARAGDAVGGPETAAADAALREQYRAALEEERSALAGAGGPTPRNAEEQDRLRRLDAVRRQLPELTARAERAKAAMGEAGKRTVDGLRARLAAERQLAVDDLANLQVAEGETRALAGKIALRSYQDVSGQLHRLLLRADAGATDASWQRRQERTRKIQAMEAQKAANLAEMEQDFKGVLKEAGE